MIMYYIIKVIKDYIICYWHTRILGKKVLHSCGRWLYGFERCVCENKLETNKKPILKKRVRLQDINTLDIDEITIEGYNFREISQAIKILLIEKGFKMYGKEHKWRIKEEEDLQSWGIIHSTKL